MAERRSLWQALIADEESMKLEARVVSLHIPASTVLCFAQLKQIALNVDFTLRTKALL